MFTMQRQYWRTAHRRAVKDARNALCIETRERFVIALLLAVIALTLIWLFGGREIAGHELIVQIALTSAVIVAFPFVYCWKLVTSPAKRQAEADARIEQLEQTRAIMSVSGPDLNYYHPRNRWRMRVHNRGPAVAANVRMKLLQISPKPRYSPWQADYPYPVAIVGLTIDAPECRINPNDDAHYQVATGWQSGGGDYFTSIDTRTNEPTRLELDERWTLSYEVTAGNAEAIAFSLRMFIENGQVKLERVT